MDEVFVSGYCRVMDEARTVTADPEEGTADCRYPDCVYASDCPIAKKLRKILDR